MAKSNKSKFAIMGMLACAPKSSGYDIRKMMEESTEYFWKESYGSIYPVLGNLIVDGLIKQHENQTEGGRERNVYELTSDGKKELKEWINKPVEYEQQRNELLLKLFFGEFVPAAMTKKHVEAFQAMLVEKEKTFQSIRENLEKEHKDAAGLPYWLITLDHGITQVKALMTWCENTLKVYKKLESSK